jgi:hypothetical protein
MFASKDTLLTRPSGGYTIARSVRLRSSAGAYLNRTPASAGNRQKWTLSAWMKIANIGGDRKIFSTSVASTPFSSIYLGSDDRLTYYEYTGSNYVVSPAQLFRDPSAWYHIVIAYDSAQATASNRTLMYVNGVVVTSFNSSSYVPQNTSSQMNSAVATYIAQAGNSSGYYDGYLTEINFIDGQALTPSSFGSTNAITGVWQPAKYTGTYGTNGFYLNFSNNSNNTATTIGKDYSGNGNNWTPNNISVTAGSTYDSMTDVCTLTSATAANYAVMNPLDVTNTGTRTIDAGNLNINTSSGSGGARSTFQLPVTGKWYFEGQYVSGTWSGNKGFGIGTSTSDISGNVIPTGCVTYNVNGQKTTGGAYSAYGSSYTTTDTVGIAVDQDAGTVTFYKNNTSQGAITHGLSVSNLFPSFVDPSAVASVQSLNFGQRPFTYTPPTGYVALNTYNLPAGTITTSGSFTGNVSTDGPFVYLNGVPTAMTINGNAVTFGTNADKLANGFKVRSSSSSYNASGSNTYSITTTGAKFKNAIAQTNP